MFPTMLPLSQTATIKTKKKRLHEQKIQLPHGDVALKDLILNLFGYKAVCLQNISIGSAKEQEIPPLPFPLFPSIPINSIA